MANTWNKAGTTWGYNSWESDTVTVSLTGISITATLGEALSYPEQGWGRFAWGQKDWGDNSVTIPITGLSMTGSVGTPAAFSEQGWGRATWGNEPWGDSNSPTVSLSGFSITASLGTLPYAQSESGWGRDEWGIGNWGENTTTVIISGFEMTGHQGPDAWGQAPWGEMVGWGGDLRCETTQLSIASPTGIEATLSLGTATISRLDMIDFAFTGPAAMSAGLGVLNINSGADHSQGVGSLLITGSLGSPNVEVTKILTGIEITASLATLTITEAQLVDLTGIEATGSLGSLTIDDMAIGLSGLAITGSVGSFTITDMQVGLSGIEISGTLGSAGTSPLHYKDIDITGNTSYTYVEHTG